MDLITDLQVDHFVEETGINLVLLPGTLLAFERVPVEVGQREFATILEKDVERVVPVVDSVDDDLLADLRSYPVELPLVAVDASLVQFFYVFDACFIDDGWFFLGGNIVYHQKRAFDPSIIQHLGHEAIIHMVHHRDLLLLAIVASPVHFQVRPLLKALRFKRKLDLNLVHLWRRGIDVLGVNGDKELFQFIHYHVVVPVRESNSEARRHFATLAFRMYLGFPI